VTHIIIATLVLASALPHAYEVQKPPVNPDAKVLLDFKERVDKYVELRKKADDSAPPLKKTDDAAELRAAQQALAERIGAARTPAKQGDIFTPEIAAYFRKLVRPELKETGTKGAVRDDNPAGMPFQVNGPYPSKEALSTMPPNVLASLPRLPKDIEYRFVGKHLILRDVRANLIIDYIPNALN
jgi:hypothetical protein